MRSMTEDDGEENVQLCHYRREEFAPILRHITLRIDNSQHQADEVVRRVVDYADCLIEELRQDENYWEYVPENFWVYRSGFFRQIVWDH